MDILELFERSRQVPGVECACLLRLIKDDCSHLFAAFLRPFRKITAPVHTDHVIEDIGKKAASDWLCPFLYRLPMYFYTSGSIFFSTRSTTTWPRFIKKLYRYRGKVKYRRFPVSMCGLEHFLKVFFLYFTLIEQGRGLWAQYKELGEGFNKIAYI